ncbi:MAG: stearoyl-CoA 9-desaturase [Actinomycetia bacterium]|nr:stearoyl-CoA 9-desaturase [Actinomycetes bacterium]
MTAAPVAGAPRAQARPDIDATPKSNFELILLVVFIVVPFLAVLAAVPLAWGWGLGWSDLAILFVFYAVSGLGITVGYHRYFTHGSFKANRPLRVALALAGSLALEMGVIDWVATHRRHHKFSDKEGDPHSPWRFGGDWRALTKGFFWAHMGWLFDRGRTSWQKYCPDLVADKDIKAISRYFPLIVLGSLGAPALLGGLLTMSWQGAVTGFFWGSLVRISLLHHVTWSINSICHMMGETPFDSRDKARNVWWLAIPSFGESWHNLHHADPTCARHGVLKGQLDSSARTIWIFEKLGWASDVRWPKADRLAAKRLA